MSRTIKRGTPPKRPTARRKTPVKRVSTLDRIVGALPVSETALKRLATWSILGVVGAVVVVAASWVGIPGMIGTALAESAGKAGFRVEQIEVTGLKRMDRMSVYAVALDQQSRAMPLVDLEAVRQKLLRYGWIADAHVSRRLPDTLLVHVVERTPAAVWQDNGQLTLIDASGVLLAPVEAHAIPDLPLVIGPGADRQEGAYQALLAAAPALRPKVRAATWVGNRRWDLTFATGETLALPQDGADRALVKFAELDGARALLGKGWKRFDMRDPRKLVARKPGADANHALADPGDGAHTDDTPGTTPSVASGAGAVAATTSREEG